MTLVRAMVIETVAWIRWRRELRQLRVEAAWAYDRWVRASYAYSDTAVIFGREPGAWSNVGPAGKAQDEAMDRMREYQELMRKVQRMEEVGPQ